MDGETTYDSAGQTAIVTGGALPVDGGIAI